MLHIPKEGTLEKFWNSNSLSFSRKLWLPNKTNKVIISNEHLKSLGTNSWFSVKKLVAGEAHPSSREVRDFLASSLPEAFPEASPEDQELKVKKVRLYPKKKQKKKINKWLGAGRYVYNLCVEHINKDKKNGTLKALREVIREATQEHSWLAKIPYEVRDASIRDILKAKKATAKTFKSFKFRSKKDPQQSFYVRARDWVRKRSKFSFLNKIRTSEELPELNHDLRLLKDSLNHYWLCVPVPIVKSQENQLTNVIAIDPGNRCFATCYDPKGSIYEWGVDDVERVFRLCLTIDKLTSETTQVKVRRRYILKRRIKRIRKKIRNLVDDLHRRLAKWLCQSYQVIVLPKFEAKGMSKKGKRKIGNKSVRKMLTLSHYRFREYLLNKTREYPTAKVLLVTEEYTSKTCGQCGKENQKLGSSKLFKCSKCKVKLDRDHNGARNILIKTLTEIKNRKGLTSSLL